MLSEKFNHLRHNPIYSLTLLAGSFLGGEKSCEAGSDTDLNQGNASIASSAEDAVSVSVLSELHKEKYYFLSEQLKQKEQSILLAIEQLLPPEYKEQFNRLEKRIILQSRSISLENYFENWLDYYRGHPRLEKQIQEKYAIFLKDVKSISSKLGHIPSKVELDLFEKALIKAENSARRGFQKNTKNISPESAFSLAERLERTTAVNQRRAAIEGLLDDSAKPEFSKEWGLLVDEFNKPFGWQRWDRDSLPETIFNKVMHKIDAFLLEYEKKLSISAYETDDQIIERYLVEIATYDELKKSMFESSDLGFTREFILDDGTNVRESYSTDGITFTVVKNMPDNTVVKEIFEEGLTVLREEYSPESNRELQTFFDNEGVPAVCREWGFDADNKVLLLRESNFKWDGSLNWVSDAESRNFKRFGVDGKAVFVEGYTEDFSSVAVRGMYDRQGQGFSVYSVERRRDPSMTVEGYINFLAEKLDNDDRLELFFREMLEYTPDNGEYWQSPKETVLREKNGKMLGDCEDYAFLAQAILRKQGINAHVINIPRHAECFWLSKNEDGTYNGHSIGTALYDRNGILYGEKPSSEKAGGYATKKEAVNSLMLKYKDQDFMIQYGRLYTIENDYARFLNYTTRRHYSGSLSILAPSVQNKSALSKIAAVEH